ncbi:MAG: TetR/AcrR family transcriptional regulator [Candidatus Atribacteria bacterium]|nr:TetR/AcrR family transcriptional regulator [Candidatus Atribacteria bacterium]
MIDKKQRILEAAKKIFAEKSYFEATLEEISDRSGVKKSTIYYYFNSKLDLMVGLIDQVILQAMEKVKDISIEKNQKERVASIIDKLFSFIMEERELMTVFQRAGYDFLHHHNTLERFKKVMDKFQLFRDNFGDTIGDVITIKGHIISGKELMRVLTSSIWGYCIDESKEGKMITEDKKEMFKEIFTSFLRE